uniref:Transmembrane protein n=1 Tax=Parascaris equorum TaxID=6256 RepID=A0A914RJX9_PAREQ
MNSVEPVSSDCICMANASSECLMSIGALIRLANEQIWRNYKTSSEYLAGADFYTIVILSLFASIIGLLLIRVTILLNSMRVRVEIEDSVRQRRKLREAKEKAQKWLQEARHRSVKSFPFRKTHSNSESGRLAFYAFHLPLKFSSLLDSEGHKSQPPRPHHYGRAASHLGFVPEIVVTPEIIVHRPTVAASVESASGARRLSRLVFMTE